MRIGRWLIVLTAAVTVAVAATAARAQGLSLIRDAEIEGTVRAYAYPIFAAAGLDPEAVRIHIVNQDSLNAFVAGGQQLFINTGTLARSSRPGEVIGVIAHEAGHISGGHLARIQDELRNARIKSILALLAGAAAAVASGEPGAAGAIGIGGQDVALKGLLKYTRTQESAADAAALKYLDTTGQSARGLMDFFELLRRDTYLAVGRRNEYLSTHPLTEDRITAVANHIMLSRFSNNVDPPELQRRHDRMRAKLIGYLATYDSTLRNFPPNDKSVPARYARSLAYSREGELANALPEIDSLIADFPDDPYFHETKGQILRENGRVAASLEPYQRAVELAPDEPLLQMSLAQVQLELNDPAYLDTATALLQAAARAEPDTATNWRLLAVAHGRSGRKGEMALAQAEYSWLRGENNAARGMAERAEKLLPPGSPGWLRAQDLQTQIDRE